MEYLVEIVKELGLPTVLCLVLIFRLEKAINKLRDSVDSLKDTFHNHFIAEERKEDHGQVEKRSKTA